MMPVRPLIKEHRLIERMITVMDRELQKIKKGDKVDVAFIETAVDFIKTYADKCHHGKEEYILFRELAKKKMSPEHKKIMDELIKEHALGRNNVKKLVKAKEDYVSGNKNSLKDIIENMELLVKFYPKHIEKEDKHFFSPCMRYFSKEEKGALLDEMQEFDKNLIHERYMDMVENLG